VFVSFSRDAKYESEVERVRLKEWGWKSEVDRVRDRGCRDDICLVLPSFSLSDGKLRWSLRQHINRGKNPKTVKRLSCCNSLTSARSLVIINYYFLSSFIYLEKIRLMRVAGSILYRDLIKRGKKCISIGQPIHLSPWQLNAQIGARACTKQPQHSILAIWMRTLSAGSLIHIRAKCQKNRPRYFATKVVLAKRHASIPKRHVKSMMRPNIGRSKLHVKTGMSKPWFNMPPLPVDYWQIHFVKLHVWFMHAPVLDITRHSSEFTGPILLGCDRSKENLPNNEPDWRDLQRHDDEDQIKLDVNRSFVYYPQCKYTWNLIL
jgi:hypothetical protein